MVRAHAPRLLLLTAVVLVTLTFSLFAGALRGDPAVNDNGNGTKTVTWDFRNPANYTISNIAMGPNDAELQSTTGGWAQTSTGDFAANGTPDSAAQVTNGSVRLAGNEANLVADGDFSQGSIWTWTNGSNGTTNARLNSGNGELVHATSENNSQFDSMDTGGGWSAASSLGATSVAVLDSSVKTEGANSMKDTISLPTSAMWAGISRTGATWDFTRFNRLSAWVSSNFSGPGSLVGFLHLATATASWNSTPAVVPVSWNRLEFDFTPFGSNLSAVNRLDLRFTGAVAVGVHVYIDDLWSLYRKSVDDTASFAQTFVKPTTGTGQPGSVLLWWDSAAFQASNTSLARLEVSVRNAIGSSQAWSIDFSMSFAWTTQSMDLSVLMAPAGTYTITFSLRVAIDTHLPTAVTLRIDNVLLRAPDYRDGMYTSKAFDAGGAAVWGQLGWTALEDAQTLVTLETRTGSTATPGDPTWSEWRTHFAPERIGSPYDRFVQFRALLHTVNSSRSPALLDVSLGFSRYTTMGWFQTTAFTPPETLVGWRRFNASANVTPPTTLVYEISTNGVDWAAVAPGENLSSLRGSSIHLRAWLSTSNTSLSPHVVSMLVTYEYVGALWTATLSPSSWRGTADETQTFAAQGFDRWGHPIGFNQTWETTDPGALPITGGVYEPHTVGSWVVRVRNSGGPILANASVTVLPGALTRLDLSPPLADAPVGSQLSFSLRGFDSDGNSVALTATAWAATGGTFVGEGPAAAILRLPGDPGVVDVTARHGTVTAVARVNVNPNGTPVISPTVPDQSKWEDQTWSLDLTSYAANQPDPSDTLQSLKWYLTEGNGSLYTVWGENYTGNHVLVFSGVPNAFGTNQARLWLEDAMGARTFQALTITLAPVNDPPHFDTVPNLPVKAGKPFPFDVGPYIVDVDTPPTSLTLTTSDPAHVAVSGLNLTLTYGPEDLGRTIYLRLAASDGEFTAQTVTKVTVTSNTPPHVVYPLPDLTLREDEPLTRAFSRSLSEYFADEDGDDLFFSYGYRNINVTIWNNAGFWQVDVRPDRDWNGVERVTFRATDSKGAFAEYSSVATVTPVNDPPTLSWSSDVFVRFDTPYVLELGSYIGDVDTPLDGVRLEASPSRFIQVHGFTATFLYPRFALGGNPSYNLSATFYVNDTDAGDSHRIFVHVSDNAPPILRLPLPDVEFDEDSRASPYRLSDYFLDPDNPAGALSFTSKGVNVRADIGMNSLVAFSAAANWFGQEVVEIRAEDANRGFAIASVVVRVNPVDDAPVFRQLEDRDLTGGGVMVIDLRRYVSDVDDPVETLTFTVSGSYAAIYGYLLVLDVPAGASPFDIQVNATDPGGLSRSSSFHVAVYQPTIWAQVLWPWSGVGALALAIALLLVWELYLRFPHTLEDLFVIGREGRLIMHNTRRLRADRDEDILAGMLTAIMLFVRDSFREEHEDLKQFEFGDRKVLVERGHYCYIAAIFAGTAPPWARRDLVTFISEVEVKLGDRLRSWSGDRDDLGDLKGMTEDFVRRRRFRNGRWPFPARAS